MTPNARLAILGTGNIGRAMAVGLVSSGRLKPGEIILTRRRTSALDDLAGQGYQVQADNPDATRRAEIVIVAVGPHQLDALLEEIAPEMNPERHLLISVVSGASIAAIQAQIGGEIPVIRAMPNTAIGLGR